VLVCDDILRSSETVKKYMRVTVCLEKLEMSGFDTVVAGCQKLGSVSETIFLKLFIADLSFEHFAAY